MFNYLRGPWQEEDGLGNLGTSIYLHMITTIKFTAITSAGMRILYMSKYHREAIQHCDWHYYCLRMARKQVIKN